MFWISTDKALPAFDEQVVKVKVADFGGDHITDAWYSHKYGLWFSIKGYCLNDNVYAWKHYHPIKRITHKEINEAIERWLY